MAATLAPISSLLLASTAGTSSGECLSACAHGKHRKSGKVGGATAACQKQHEVPAARWMSSSSVLQARFVHRLKLCSMPMCRWRK